MVQMLRVVITQESTRDFRQEPIDAYYNKSNLPFLSKRLVNCHPHDMDNNYT